MYARKKANASNSNDGNSNHGKAGVTTIRRLPARATSFSASEDEGPASTGISFRRRARNEKASLQELHMELAHLAATEEGKEPTTDHTPTNNGDAGGAVKRLLKGKKLVRVKRIPVGRSASTLEVSGEEGPANGERKVMRIKVKRKKKEDPSKTPGVDSTAQPQRGVSRNPSSSSRRRGRRRNQSDASVGTGMMSRAKSWFTFGGLKLSTEKNLLGGDDEEEDDQRTRGDDTLDQRTRGDDTLDLRTRGDDTLDLRTRGDDTKEEGPDTLAVPPSSQSPAPTTTGTTATSTPTTTISYIPAPDSPRTLRWNTKTMGKRPPTLEVVCHKTLTKKMSLKGIALRRMQIQEHWLSKGTTYDESKHSILTASTADTSDDTNSIPDDISELSYDESPPLIMGADAAPNQEVVFWTTNCHDQVNTYGSPHSRTGIAFLNKGIAELNVRQTATAIESFLTAVQLLQERHGESHLAVGRAMHLLGSAFFLDGQLPMAVDATRKAFDIRKEILGALHTDTVDTFSNLAMVYLRMDRLVEAARIFNEVLKIRKVIYDPHHPSVAFPSRSLGCVYAKRQDLERAKQNYVHALDCFQAHHMLAEMSDTQAEMRRFGIEPLEPKVHPRLEI
jgi:hypothetical protein